jgi:ferrous iron transport protein A
MGQAARVVKVQGEGSLSIRLMEMGLTPGTVVALIKRAPLGDPLEVRVRDYHVSLRKADAARVEVEVA